MTIKQLIKDAAKEWEKKQLSTSTFPQYDAPQLLANEFQAGALWAMRWWAERFERLNHASINIGMGYVEIDKEMRAAAKEILEGGK